MATALSPKTDLQNMELTTMPITSTPALTPNNNMTSEEIEQYLDQLQDEEIKQFIPTLVFLLLLAVTGLVGNVLVLLVYRFKYSKSPIRIFIMSLALFDLITNVVCIPGHVFGIFHMWNFAWPSLCGLIKYFNSGNIISSACILLAVSVSRYKKICKPFGKQATILQAKISTVCAAVFSWIASIPFFILNGSHSRPTPIPGIVGHDCYITDEYINTIWPTVQYGFNFILFLSLCIPMVVLYTLIGIKAYKHRKIHGVGPVQVKEKSSSQKSTKNKTLDLTESKPWRSMLFAFIKRKNNSKDRQPEKAFEKGKKPMTEENWTTEKTEDCCVVKELPQIYKKKVVDFSVSSDMTPDSIKLKETDYDGENKSYVNISYMDHETTVEAGIKTHDCKIKDVDDQCHGPCPEFERTHNQNTVSTDIESHENSSRQCGLASRLACSDMTYSLKKDNKDQPRVSVESLSTSTSCLFMRVSQQSSIVVETEDNSSIRGEKIQTLGPNDVTNRSQISAFELKDIAIKTPKRAAKTVDECNQTSTIEGKNMSNETTVDLEKHKIVLFAQDEKNSQKGFFKKTTGILFLITVVFIVSFIPHFATVFFRYLQPENFKTLGTSSLSAYHLFFRSYLINSAANPIVYSLCGAKFRHRMVCLFTRC